MNEFSKFDEIPSMILEVIKETKRYGQTVGRSFGRSDGRTDNVKTVYPPTNTVCRGYKYPKQYMLFKLNDFIQEKKRKKKSEKF